MTGAMYAAIAGLKTHMNKMNVIGNNIANVNTTGYKAQRTIFKDAMYTMYSNGSDGTETVGSKNPSQIGYGSQISSIDLNMGSGSYTPGNSLDCMIDGDGFFLTGDKDVANVINATNPQSFKSLSLTRVGDFKFGADGYLVDGNGNCVYGFLSLGMGPDGKNPVVSDQLVPIRLPQVEKVIVSLTAELGIGTEITADQITEDMVEGTHYEYKSVVRYPVAATNEEGQPIKDAAGFSGEVTDIPLMDYDKYMNANPGEDAEEGAAPLELAFAQLDSISIDESTGRISGTVKDSDEWITLGFLAIGNVTNPNGVTHTGGFYYSCSDGAGDLQVSLMGGAEESLTVPGGGKLQYVNGSLLQGEGEDAEVPSQVAAIGSAGTTGLLTGGLEGSNVDLATEISEMITTQRGYQANTRIITVTDTMLEELVNMKR